MSKETEQVLVDALNLIASWGEGVAVGSHFDEPNSAQIAREALAAHKAIPPCPDYRRALADLVAEFKRVYPIYYYAEPWAHNRNAALLNAELVLAGERNA